MYTIVTCFLLIIAFGLVYITQADDIANTQAVESVGEINAKDNSTGTVIAGTTAELVLTLIADMSQAEPGEEIKFIQITAPTGFTVKDDAVKFVRVGADEIFDPEFVVDRNRIIVVLPKLITLTTMVDIEFNVETPPTVTHAWPFIVGLLNILQDPILVSIKPGNSDGKVNNDTLAVKVVAATKPEPPTGLTVQPDPGGENDIVLSWDKSSDELVSGYLIYRSDRGDEPVADITSREQRNYIDRNLPSGESFSYTIRTYKTKVLRSEPSNELSAIVPEDTKAPTPPVVRPEAMVVDKAGVEGIEVVWESSVSRDVVNYIVYRGSSVDSLESIAELDSEATFYIDDNPPDSGSYVYVIGAVDDAGNESRSSATLPRQVFSGAKPQPNPFTPLSTDARFNQVIFPAAMVAGGEGVFYVNIYDLEGYLITEIEAPEGSKEVRWDGKSSDGEYVNGGIYVYQAFMGNVTKVGTVVVAK
ncbi:hypothetical protein GF312_01200 [Candidatus Poribacteria bacterium]|nr:hypothetical protein [Candidatus Poribacteria bacterium]